MLDLATCQRRFVEALDGLRDGDPLLAVYRNTWMRGAIDALADNYPTIATILGMTAFEPLAAHYVRLAPPDSPILAAYGKGFADWLGAQPAAPSLPYLAAVAQIDRLRTEAHLALDADPFDPALLAGLSAERWSQSGAILHPATRFGWFPTAATAIWLAHQQEPPADMMPVWRSEGILITRPAGGVLAERIGAVEHRILCGLAVGETIGQAAAVAATLYPTACITDAFRRILTSGAITALKPKRI